MLTSRRTFLEATTVVAGMSLFPILTPLQAQAAPTSAPADGTILVVAPEDWADLAERVTEGLRATGHTATVAIPDEEGFVNGWQGERVVLGHLGNNDHIARLYGLYVTMADSIAPGTDGWSVMSIDAPFGGTSSTIIVGASTRTGAEAGIATLLDHLTEGPLPKIHQAVLSPDSQVRLPNEGVIDAAYGQEAIADIETRIGNLKPSMGNELDARALHTLMSGIAVNSKYFTVFPSDVFAKVYRKAMLGYSAFLLDNPEAGADQLANSRNMWTSGLGLIGGWRVMESTDLFTEDERARIMQALILTFQVNAKDGYLVKAPDRGPRWNHEIFPALSLAAAGLYFEARGELEEAKGWSAMAARIFDGNTSPVSLDEGSDYLMHLPMATIDYGMLTGRRTFLATTVRPSADLNALMIDNLGAMCGGGDTYPLWLQRPVQLGPLAGHVRGQLVLPRPHLSSLVADDAGQPVGTEQAGLGRSLAPLHRDCRRRTGIRPNGVPEGIRAAHG